MKPFQDKTNKKDDKSWIFIVVLLLGLGFVLSSVLVDDHKSANNQNPDHMKRVDGYLKDTSFNLEADRRQRQIEYYQQINKYKDTQAQSGYTENQNFSLESDPNMLSLTQELNRSQSGYPDQATPEEIVQQRLYENDQLKKANEAYRQAYAEQFKENARRGGWEVELGPNFEVLSVRKLKTNRNPSLFQDNGEMGGSR